MTLPISGVFIALGVKSLELAYDFLEHWEDLTGNLFADEVLSAHQQLSIDRSEGFIHENFFEQDPSRASLSFPRSSITLKMLPKFLAKTQHNLPAKPGDLLWILERFFLDTFPTGGEVDPVSVSEHPTYSIYAQLMAFASRVKYQHHPHIDTLKAMAHLSEQGVDDRRVPWNILLVSLELLRPGSISKKKNLKRTLPGGSKIETSRLVRIISAGPAAPTMVAFTVLPDLVETAEELGEVEDVTDQEEIGENDDDDDDDDDDEDNDEDEDDDEMDWKNSRGDKRKHSDDDEDNEGASAGGAGSFDKVAHKKRFGVRRTKAS
jgi:hypothetical protein